MSAETLAEEFLGLIETGFLDDHLGAIEQKITERRREVSPKELAPGAIVKVTSPTIRPKYMIGREFEVKKLNPRSVVVDIPNEPGYGRFAGHKGVRIPKSCVEVV